MSDNQGHGGASNGVANSGGGLPMAVPVGLAGAPPPPVPPPADDDAMELDDAVPADAAEPTNGDAPPADAQAAPEEAEPEERKPTPAEVLAKLNALAPKDGEAPPVVRERMPTMEVELVSEVGGQGSQSPSFGSTLEVASAELVATLIPETGGMPLLEQMGPVTVGPGADKEAMLRGLGLPKLSSRQLEDLSNAKKYAMEQSIKHVLLRQTAAHQANQQKVAMYAQALSLMARIYIGSISFEIREETIKQTFGPFGPIKSINMSWDPVTGHHKGFAFLEYDVPEAALLAQEQMNGVLLGGRNIKVSAADEGVKVIFGQQVNRPANTPQATPIIEMVMTEAREYHRIYVSSIHQELNEAEVKSVFEAFGKVKSAILAKGGANNAVHRGYGYIEYESPGAVQDAVNSMNLFDLGGQHLRVGKAITPPQAQSYVVPTAAASLPTAAAVAAAAVTAKIQAMEASTGHKPVAAGGTGQAPQVVVGGTSDNMTTNTNTGAVFTVPSVGLATVNASSIGGSNGHSSSGFSSPAPSSASTAAVPPPSVVTVTELGAAPTPLAVTAGPADGTFAAPTAPAPSAAKKKTTAKKSKRDTPVDSTGTALVLKQDAMSLLFGLHNKRQAEERKKKRPPSKKKRNQKTEEEKQGEITGAKFTAQQMNTACTAQKILASGVLTDKQKQMLELQAGASLAAQEDIKIKGNEARNILMHKLMRKAESRVVVLRNMVGAGDVDEELQADIEEECSKSGEVESVIIYQEKESDAADAAVHVKIFVAFSMPEEAVAAKTAMHDRWFGGRQVTAELYEQSLFDHNDLTA